MSLYEKLSLDDDQLRLIELIYESPAGTENEALIHASLSVQNSSNLLEYDALSYTWGTQQELVDINLNGRHFPIGPNLLSALRQLQSHARGNSKRRKLWIDAICIDQSDNDDKSRQVMRMKDIYADAEQVLILIGEPDNLSELAFDTL